MLFCFVLFFLFVVSFFDDGGDGCIFWNNILFSQTSILFASVLQRDKTFWWLLNSMLVSPACLCLYTQRSCRLLPLCILFLVLNSNKRCNPYRHTLVRAQTDKIPEWQAEPAVGRTGEIRESVAFLHCVKHKCTFKIHSDQKMYESSN